MCEQDTHAQGWSLDVYANCTAHLETSVILSPH